MKKFLLLLALPFFVFSCSSHQTTTTTTQPAPKGAHLSLSASPRQGFAPMRVTFHVALSGVDPNDKEFYCQREEWDFGDGAVSAEQPQCDPYTSETKINTEFFVEHVYEDIGEYDVFFTLGEHKLKSNKIQVLVIENRIPKS